MTCQPQSPSFLRIKECGSPGRASRNGGKCTAHLSRRKRKLRYMPNLGKFQNTALSINIADSMMSFPSDAHMSELINHD
jgi:hypothetical protein